MCDRSRGMALSLGLGWGAGLLLSIAITATSAAGGDGPSGMQQLRSEIEQRLKSYDQQEADARSTLERGQIMRDKAAAQGDSDTADIAAQAADKAQQTLEVLRQRRVDDLARLKVVEGQISAKVRQTVALLTRGPIMVETTKGTTTWDGQALPDGETISVPTGSYLELLTRAGAVVDFAEGVRCTFQEAKEGPLYRILKGRVHYRHQSGSSSEEQFRVPATAPERSDEIAIAGKGTEFTFSADLPRELTVLDGVVVVTFPRGKIVGVKAGQKLDLAGDPSALAPSAVDLDKVPIWWLP